MLTLLNLLLSFSFLFSVSAAGILISQEEIDQLPDKGNAWDNLFYAAQQSTDNPNLSNQDDNTDVHVLAKALVYAKTGNQSYRSEVITACIAAIGTQQGGRTLALGRNLSGYILAADLVGLPSAEERTFKNFVDSVRYEVLDGKTLISTHNDRPNNWGTHAGAARLAAGLYLQDTNEVNQAIRVFHGWLGDRSVYNRFKYGELSWQCNPGSPTGINPMGCLRDGHPIDGVLGDDQRRAGSFQWPPTREGYVYGALQGALLQAILISRYNSDDVWNWGNRALLRAFQWLHRECNFQAEGDDEWQIFTVNYFYNDNFPTVSNPRFGKGFGFTDWLYSNPNPNTLGPPIPPSPEGGGDSNSRGIPTWTRSLGCFSPTNSLQVQDKEGLVSMDSIKIGDYVRDSKGTFSRVISFLHLDSDAEVEFLQFQTDDFKAPLEITPEHMIFVNNASRPVPASQVKVGDMLGENKVSAINNVKRLGAYAPVTESGMIVVNEVLASSYAALHSYTPINQHTEAHVFFAARRLVCAFNFGLCKSETYTDDGFPKWMSPMIYFALSTEQNPPAQFLVSVIGLPFVAVAYTLEQMIHYSFFVFGLILGFIAYKKKTQGSKVKGL